MLPDAMPRRGRVYGYAAMPRLYGATARFMLPLLRR